MNLYNSDDSRSGVTILGVVGVPNLVLTWDRWNNGVFDLKQAGVQEITGRIL